MFSIRLKPFAQRFKKSIFDKNFSMRTLANQDFSNLRAVVRVDFNVPIDDEFQVTDSTRITAAKETIDYILNQGGSCVLISHLGRPKGKDPKLSLSHIVSKVEEILQVPVTFFGDCIGSEAEQATASLAPGSVILMENLRFYKEETFREIWILQKVWQNWGIAMSTMLLERRTEHMLQPPSWLIFLSKINSLAGCSKKKSTP